MDSGIYASEINQRLKPQLIQLAPCRLSSWIVMEQESHRGVTKYPKVMERIGA